MNNFIAEELDATETQLYKFGWIDFTESEPYEDSVCVFISTTGLVLVGFLRHTWLFKRPYVKVPHFGKMKKILCYRHYDEIENWIDNKTIIQGSQVDVTKIKIPYPMATV